MTFIAGIVAAFAGLAAFHVAREEFRRWRLKARVQAYLRRQVAEAEAIRLAREEMLRLMPEVTQVPWGFSFMGTGTENTETNCNLGPTYSGPITGRFN